ncbi:unnamed protein product [Auanema sp. JU1783]|nr:unnamed protein product [Auanema sp. JU1783]
MWGVTGFIKVLQRSSLLPRVSSVRENSVFNQFFDDEANFAKSELRPKKRPGRSWTVEELRLKSNTDVHKLWYVCLKEKNMLLTMRAAYVEQARYMPNPERLDRVKETMQNIEQVVHERNDAYYKLETGDSADVPLRTVTSFMGFTYKRQSTEHYSEANPKEIAVEVPYLDDDAYMMQKLWKEKEHLKKRDSMDMAGNGMGSQRRRDKLGNIASSKFHNR